MGEMSHGYIYGDYRSSESPHTSEYLWERIIHLVNRFVKGKRLLDAGCGNGAFCRRLVECRQDSRVCGIDLSSTGIAHARQVAPECTFEVGSVYEDMFKPFGHRFDAVISLEVIEHLYDPRRFLARVVEALDQDGVLIFSTPYHGYVKNLLLAVLGKMDGHFSALWDGGHIKFWSRHTIRRLLEHCGFETVHFEGAGRLPYLWKSMIQVARPRIDGKPSRKPNEDP